MTDKRNHMVELLRFLAASYVAVFHFNKLGAFGPVWYQDFFKLGYLGVPIFFVISGYCIQIAARHAKNPKDFIIRRLFRLFPAYWLSIIVVMITVVFWYVIKGVNSVAPLPKTPFAVVETLMMLSTPFSNVQIINWVYWTLPYELFFYLITMISLTLHNRYRDYIFVLIAVLALVLPMHEHWPLFFLQHWPAYCLGIVTYRILHHDEKFTLLNLLLLALSVAGLVKLIYLPYYAIACLVATVLIVFNHFKPMKSNFFARLGDYSYSVYLFHVPIGIYLFEFVRNLEIMQKNIWANVLWDFMLLAILQALAYFVYKKVELPFIQLGKRFAGNIKKPI